MPNIGRNFQQILPYNAQDLFAGASEVPEIVVPSGAPSANDYVSAMDPGNKQVFSVNQNSATSVVATPLVPIDSNAAVPVTVVPQSTSPVIYLGIFAVGAYFLFFKKRRM